MIKQGEVIKHINSMDVAIQVMYTSVNPENGNIWVRGLWLNQFFVETRVITTKRNPYGIPVELDITPEQASNWLRCTKKEAKCIRYEKWVPIK